MAKNQHGTVEWKLATAEEKIQRILIDLDSEIGKPISHVRVDTRNFENYNVEIHLED